MTLDKIIQCYSDSNILSLNHAVVMAVNFHGSIDVFSPCCSFEQCFMLAGWLNEAVDRKCDTELFGSSWDETHTCD